MGMIRVEIVRPTEKGRIRLKTNIPIGEQYSDPEHGYLQRSTWSWNTKHIMCVRESGLAELDLPGTESVIVTPLGEFHSPEPLWELAARIHEADERGVDLEVCDTCGMLTAQTVEGGRCRKCAEAAKAKKAEAAS